MAVTPVQASGAIPMNNAAGTAGINTAANYRQGLLGALLGPYPGTPQAWRPGVLATQMTSGAYGDLRVTQTGTASAQVNVAPGNCVVVRSGSAGGPYLVNFNTTSTLTTDGASTVNPRIDVVYVQVTDVSGLGDSGTAGGQLGIVDGTPAASPVAPSVPTGAAPIAQLYRPTVAGGGNNVLTANITDVRKGATAYGGVRPLLAGDALTDAGSYVGEMTYDGITSKLAGLRYWGYDSQWHGVTSAHYTQSLANAVTITPNTYQTLLTITVSDPGWPYLAKVSGAVLALNGATAGVAPFAWITLDSTAGNSGVIIGSENGPGNNEDTDLMLPGAVTGTLTGAHTFRLIADSNGGNSWAGQNSGSATVNPTWLTVSVYPY